MPGDPSIRSVLVIGSGPIVIGQACEFDYSGTQAIKALRKEGIRVSLVNSNPATIMTDPEYADRTYIEPLTPEAVEAILERERPDALLPTVGGQTALNLAVELSRRGVLDRHRVQPRGVHRARGPRHRPLARPPGPYRGVRARLEGVRARGDAGQGRQLRGDLLDRELRPDGHPHRRLGHGGARPDADRPRVPGDAQRRARDHPRGRRRDRRLEHPVRGRPGERPPDPDPHEPPPLPIIP